jgi:sporulation protein YlmC with PRC-barrel domain
MLPVQRGRLPGFPFRPRKGVGTPRALGAGLARGRFHPKGAVDASLIGLSAILGGHVFDGTGRAVGRLDDVVVRWPRGRTYPAVSAIVIRNGRQTFTIGARSVRIAAPATVSIDGPGAYAHAPDRHPGDIALAHDVLDHQLFDASGAEVLRPADLYLATINEAVELAGVEVGVIALLRRLGPRRMRRRPRPERVIDWADIAGFVSVRAAASETQRRGTSLAGASGTGVKLREGPQKTLDAAGVEDALEAQKIRSSSARPLR